MHLNAIPLFFLLACSAGKDGTPDSSGDTGAANADSGDSVADTGETALDSAEDSGEDSAAETGTDSAEDSGADTDTAEDTATDTAEDTAEDTADDTGTPLPIPESSRCIVSTDTTGGCTNGVYAEDWSGDTRYEWAITDGYNHSSLTATSGGTTTEIATVVTMSSWHMTGGLTVMPDGDLVLGGITLPYVTLTVGADSVYLGPDYVRFIARISPTGELRWVKTFIGITAESVVVAGRADDSVLVSGFVYQETVFGAYEVTPSSYFWDYAFVAAMDGDGEWLWASGATTPTGGYTRVYFDDMVESADGGASVNVRYLSSTDLSVGSLTCAKGVTCPATATVSSSGEWTDVVAR